MGAAGLAKAAGEFGRGVDAAAAIYAKVDAKAEKKAEKEQELKSGAIELKDVRFQYGSAEKPVVSSLSLSIKSGEIVALVGKNGTGKSTLVSLISNLLPADAGDVNVGGVPLGSSTKVPPHSIGLVPQHSSLFDASVLDNVMYGTHFESARGREIECDRVLELVGASGFVKGLEGGKDFVVGESGSRLSGGQKQRLSLARGLVGGCKVVLFDEPDTYLEDNTAVAEAVKSCRDAGMTVVVVTHHLHIVRMCDRVVELGEGGKVVSDGTLKEYEKGAVGGMVV
jgi:ABC-type bacteriocin/lantibiotic exporter with double-glycine peptidase domain